MLKVPVQNSGGDATGFDCLRLGLKHVKNAGKASEVHELLYISLEPTPGHVVCGLARLIDTGDKRSQARTVDYTYAGEINHNTSVALQQFCNAVTKSLRFFSVNQASAAVEDCNITVRSRFEMQLHYLPPQLYCPVHFDSRLFVSVQFQDTQG